MAGKKQAAATAANAANAAKKGFTNNAEFEEEEAAAENWEEDSGAPERPGGRPGLPPGIKLRDWRDVERYREGKELQKKIDEDFDFDDL